MAGLNRYGILEPCYHGRNPYRGPGAAEPPSLEAVQAAQRSVRRWPLLGAAQAGRVPGLVQMGLGHTPPCLDSRCGRQLLPCLRGAPAAYLEGSSTPPLQQCWRGTALPPGLACSCLSMTTLRCPRREMWAFCNSDEVRAAIHARSKEEIGHFDECTNGERGRAGLCIQGGVSA